MLHPLTTQRKTGPIDHDAPPPDPLAEADRVLSLVEKGKLIPKRKEPLPVEVDHKGKPKRPLTLEEEASLARMIHESGNVDARNALILANAGVIPMIARQLGRGRDASTADLLQEGMLGLLRATETYDPTRGIRFSTYSAWWVRAALQKAMRDERDQFEPVMAGAEMVTTKDGKRWRPRLRTVPFEVLVEDDDDQDSERPRSGKIPIDPYPNPEQAAIAAQREVAVKKVIAEIRAETKDARVVKIIDDRILNDSPSTLSVLGKEVSTSREWIRKKETAVVRDAAEKLSCFGVIDRGNENVTDYVSVKGGRDANSY